MVILESIEIENYRSCRHVKFYLQEDLSVLIGPNGSGKTTVMNACLLLNRLVNDDSFMRRQQSNTAANKCRIKATFRIEERRAILTADIHLTTDDSNRDIVVGAEQYWYARDFTGTRTRIHAPLFIRRFGRAIEDIHSSKERTYFPGVEKPVSIPRSFLQPFREIADTFGDMKYYSASRFTDPSRCPVAVEIVQLDKGPRVSGFSHRSPHEMFILDLYDKWSDKKNSSYQAFYETIGPDGLGLVDDLKFLEIETSSEKVTVRTGGDVGTRTEKKKLVIPQFAIGGNQLSPSQLSEGTFKTIALLFYVIVGENSLLLIEEPEVCIHHGLLGSVIELIRSYSQEKQILVSTHSDAVLDMLEPRQVYMVTKNEDQCTSVTHLESSRSRQELNALRSFLSSDGGLGEYWKHGGID